MNLSAFITWKFVKPVMLSSALAMMVACGGSGGASNGDAGGGYGGGDTILSVDESSESFEISSEDSVDLEVAESVETDSVLDGKVPQWKGSWVDLNEAVYSDPDFVQIAKDVYGYTQADLDLLFEAQSLSSGFPNPDEVYIDDWSQELQEQHERFWEIQIEFNDRYRFDELHDAVQYYIQTGERLDVDDLESYHVLIDPSEFPVDDDAGYEDYDETSFDDEDFDDEDYEDDNVAYDEKYGGWYEIGFEDEYAASFYDDDEYEDSFEMEDEDDAWDDEFDGEEAEASADPAE